MWTDIYSPLCLSDMVLNSDELPSLIGWMKCWDIKSQLDSSKSKRLFYFIMSSKESRGARSRKKQVGLWDYSHSEDSYDSASDTGNSTYHSAYLILGPTGCGKTSLIYALANQFGYKVRCRISFLILYSFRYSK